MSDRPRATRPGRHALLGVVLLIGCARTQASAAPLPPEWVCEYRDGTVLYLGADTTKHEPRCIVRTLRRLRHKAEGR